MRSRADRGEEPVERRRPGDGLLLGAILLLGLVLRLFYLREIAADPTFEYPLRDAGFHDYWARALVSGDWTPPHGQPDPRIPHVPFLRPPGYPYFLAGIYALTGGSHLAARIVQMLLGLLGAGLAYRLGRVLLGRAAGLFLAAFCATSWVALFYEGDLQANALIVVLGLAALLWLRDWLDRPRHWRAIAAGFLLGLLALVYPNALLFLPLGAAWMIHAARRAPSRPGQAAGAPRARGRAWRAAILFAAAASAAILPATIRNAVVAREFVPISLNGAISFYSGNTATADGVSTDVPELARWTGSDAWSWFLYDRLVQGIGESRGRAITHGQAAGWFTARAWEEIRGDPARFLALCGRRALLFISPQEPSISELVAHARQRRQALRWSPGFAVVLGTGLVGLLLLARDGRRRRDPGLALAGLFVAAQFASVVLFTAGARYRAPALPLLFLPGAYALARILEWARAGSWGRAGIAAAATAALVAAAGVPLVAHEIDPAAWRVDRAIALDRAGREAEALDEYRAAAAASPAFPGLRAKLGALLAQRGEVAEALGHYRAAVAQRAQDAELRLSWTALLIDAGGVSEALPVLETLAAARPDLAAAHFQLGCALARSGEWAAAERALARALALEPGHPLAHLYTGMALAERGAHGEALDAYRRALGLDPGLADAHARRAYSLLALGRRDQAREALEAALALDPAHAWAHRRLETLRR